MLQGVLLQSGTSSVSFFPFSETPASMYHAEETLIISFHFSTIFALSLNH